MSKQTYDVELCRLSDGKVSVRINGTEVHILPKRQDCGLEDIDQAMHSVVEYVNPEGEEVNW